MRSNTQGNLQPNVLARREFGPRRRQSVTDKAWWTPRGRYRYPVQEGEYASIPFLDLQLLLRGKNNSCLGIGPIRCDQLGSRDKKRGGAYYLEVRLDLPTAPKIFYPP